MSAGANMIGQMMSCQFLWALSSAVSEWSLIIFLLINALLAYLATRLARFGKLPAPCLLCSRLDHILGRERRGFYRNLFCHAHKLEISSLVYCQGHKKLADFRYMCESCLLSSATIKKGGNSCGMSRKRNVLVNPEDGNKSRDKLSGEDLNNVPLIKNDVEPAAPGTRLCSCCSEPYNLRTLLLQAKKKIEGGVPDRRAQPRKRQEKPFESKTVEHLGTRDYHLLSQVGYSELKISSDSESEVPFSDDDDGYALVHVTKDIKEESVVRSRLPEGMTNNTDKGFATIVLEDNVPEKLIHPDPVAPVQTLLDTALKPINEGDSWDKPSLKSKEEIHNVSVMTNILELSESTPEKVPQAVTTETLITKGTGGVDSIPASTNIEVLKVSSPTSITSQVMTDPRNLGDRNDSFKNALANGIMQSPRFSEIVASKESPQDLKLRLSRASDLPWSDLTPSPREEFKLSDACSSMGLQNIAKRLSVERSNSYLDFFDATLISDIEGETSVDRLKQQIDLDRKSMNALYKELEEERNASAVAANEAMAMITRLQEVKASMQMEALQFLRMMEEQSEYDQEAIRKLNDLLTEREKEYLDLEAELESYKKWHREASSGEKPKESLHVSETREQNSATTPRSMKILGRSKSETTNMMPQECTDYGVQDLLQGFEEEKAQITGCLKSLQKKLHLLCTKQGDSLFGKNAIENESNMDLKNNHSGVEILSENGLSPSRKYPNIRATATLDEQVNSDEERTTSKASSSDMISLQEEVSKLIGRIERLDADREFLGHAINALKYGTDGVQLVQEIACQLKELRRIPITSKEEIVT